MKIDVDVIATVDFSAMTKDLNRRLNDAEREVFLRWQTDVQDFYQDRWTGWRYKGRPASAPRLVSFEGWHTEISTIAERTALTVVNDARDYRTGTKAYVQHVHRAGSDRLEWEVVTDEFVADALPGMVTDLSRTIAQSLSRDTPPKRVRAGNGDILEVMELDI